MKINKLKIKRSGSSLAKERAQPQTKVSVRDPANRKTAKRANLKKFLLRNYRPQPSPIRLQTIIPPKMKTITSPTSLPCQLNQQNLRGLILV